LAEGPVFEQSELIGFVQQARNYFENGSGCPPEYDFDDRLDLVEEFLTIEDQEVKEIIGSSGNEITIFMERRKPYRPGLTLRVNLNGKSCESFYIYELMN
jgi:hypothetical protein